MSEAICTCHCGGPMFYRHLHAESCVLSREGEEAPKSELETLRDERDRLRANLINCSERLAAYYGDNYPAVVDARAALTPGGQRLTPNEATE